MRQTDDLDAGERSSTDQPRPPVIARIVVEVRSDGTKTRSYGVLEDLRHGHQSQIVMPGPWPGVAVALLRNLLTASAMARQVLGAVLRPGESRGADAEVTEDLREGGTPGMTSRQMPTRSRTK
jgi:hypothetical protein